MPQISFKKLVGIATIVGTVLAAWSLLAPSVPSVNVNGDSNTTIQGSNNTVTNNTVIVHSSEKPNEIGPLSIQIETLPTLKKNHEVTFFSATSALPSYKITKINTFVKDRTLGIYRRHEKFEEVTIAATPEFIGNGLLGVNIDIEVSSPNGEVKIAQDVEPDTAAFLAYMSYAHPLQKADGFVLNIETGEPFEFKDLFRSNYKADINSLVIEKLKASHSYFECSPNERMGKTYGTKPSLDNKQIEKYLGYSFATCFSTVQDDSYFYLNPTSIVLRYSRYEIGPGMLGAVEVPLPYSAIKKLVNPNGPLAFLNN